MMDPASVNSSPVDPVSVDTATTMSRDVTREGSLLDRGNLPSWRSPLAWCTLLGVFATGLAIDLLSKSWAFETIAGYPVELDRQRILDDPSFFVPHHARCAALPWDLLDFRLVLNHGAVFGIGQQRRGLFIGFTLLATTAAIVLFARGTRARMHMMHVAVGMILAGGLGNLFDRIYYGAVRDFLHMLPEWQLPMGWHWPGNGNGDVFPWVFNIADVMLLAGMALFVLSSWIEDRRARRGGEVSMTTAA